MDAIILAGGFGTRLKTLFPDIPKPLVKINKTPFLDIILHNLLKQQIINRIILSLGYKAQLIIDHINTYFSSYPIDYSIEDSPLGTGGAIKKALKKTKSQDVLVLNGDTFVIFSLEKMVEQHKDKKADITIAYTEVINASRYGQLILEKHSDRISEFKEKDKKEKKGYINAGIYLMKKNIEEKFPKKSAFSIEKNFFPKILKKNIFGYFVQNSFIDIGTIESYHNAQNFFKKKHRKIVYAYISYRRGWLYWIYINSFSFSKRIRSNGYR